MFLASEDLHNPSDASELPVEGESFLLLRLWSGKQGLLERLSSAVVLWMHDPLSSRTLHGLCSCQEMLQHEYFVACQICPLLVCALVIGFDDVCFLPSIASLGLVFIRWMYDWPRKVTTMSVYSQLRSSASVWLNAQ